MRPTIEHRTNRAAALRRAKSEAKIRSRSPPKPRLPLPPVAMADNLYSIQRSKLQQRSKAGEHASPMSILDNHELHNIVVDEAERTWRKVLPLVPQLGVPQLVELRAFALSEAVTRQTGRAPSAQLLIVCQRMDDLLQTLIGLDGELQNATLARRARTQRSGAHSPEPAASPEPEAALQRHTEASAAAGGLAPVSYTHLTLPTICSV